MPTRKLTRKEIVREDSFHATVRETYESIIAHKRTILIGIIAALVVGLGFVVWRHYRSKSEAESKYLFGKALETFHASVQQPSGSPADAKPDQPAESKPEFKSENEKYTKALSQFNDAAKAGSGQMKALSLYYVGLCQQKLGKTDEAVKTLEADKDKLKDPRYSFLLKKSLAGLYETKGDYNTAIKWYTELLKSTASSYPKDDILMSLGRCYELTQNKDEAIKKYTQLAQEYPTSLYQREANDRLVKLGAKRVTRTEPNAINPLTME